MARNGSGTGQYLQLGSAVPATLPVSMSCWFKPDATNTLGMLCTISDVDHSGTFINIRKESDATCLMQYSRSDEAGEQAQAFSSGNYTTGWNHVCGYANFSGGNALSGVALNGATFDTASTSAPTSNGTLDETSLLALDFNSGGPQFLLAGDLAEVAIWSGYQLTQRDAKQLNLGRSPAFIASRYLVAHWKLIGRQTTEPDYWQSHDLTNTGTTQASHPPGITYPHRKLFLPAWLPVVGGATTVNVGQASETDSAFAVTVSRTYDIGQSAETDSAFAVVPNRKYAVGQAAEADSAFAVTVSGVTTVNAGQASETDTAFAVGILKTFDIGQAAETDSAFACTADRVYSVGQSAETDTAFAVVPSFANIVQQATEVASAFAVAQKRTYTLGQASETDTAFAVSAVSFVTIAGLLDITLSGSPAVRVDMTGDTAL